MQQYDRYPYNDDYNGNSVFDRQSPSSDGYSLRGIFLLALALAPFLLVGYLMETYPVVAWIVCFGGVALNVYVFYKIIKFIVRFIRKLFRGKKSAQKTIGKRKL